MKRKSITLLSVFLFSIPFLGNAQSDRNHPELAPDDGLWHKWLLHSYFDNKSDHELVNAPASICIKHIGNSETSTSYDWYFFGPNFEQTQAHGIQEGDHFIFHAENPEIVWNPDTGSRNPPSIIVMKGQTVGGTSHSSNLEKVATAFAEGIAWNPGSEYSATSVFNVEMIYKGDVCSLTDIDPGCDYSNSDSTLGWGWNEDAGEACPPLVTGCDYSDADVNDGWGWNSNTGESCPPL